MPLDTQRQALDAALRKYDPKLRKAFLDAVERAGALVDEMRLVEALDRGDMNLVLHLVRFDDASLFELADLVREAHVAGGNLASTAFPRGLKGTFAFNGRHERAEAWVRQHVGNLIDGIQREQIEAVRTAVGAGLREGRGSRKVARELVGKKIGNRRVGGFLGLNSDQTDQVMNARSILSDPDRIREYFVKDRKTGRWKPRYKLSDRRFDRQILKAIKEGRALSGRDLDAVIDAHKSKALTYRGRVIAKQEARQAIASGRDEGMAQALERDDVEAITKEWMWNLSRDPREHHRALHGQKVEIGQSFDLGNGLTAKHPHDENLPGSETIGCNCQAHYRVKFKRG